MTSFRHGVLSKTRLMDRAMESAWQTVQPQKS